MIHVGRYLERIGDRGPLEPTQETLRRIHRAHLLTVPGDDAAISRILAEQFGIQA